MGFKEDEDFARFLTMGAYAAAAVSDDLEAQGHRIIELERYAKANKIWTIKVKRLRLPDLLCIRCGRRFESKGKTKLELKLSHSNTSGREWWGGGMRDDDVFAFVRVAVLPDSIELGRIVYVTRGALHAAERARLEGGRKSISAGSERDVSWPSWTPSYSGTVTAIDGTEVSVVADSGRRATYRGGTKWPATYVYLRPGDRFAGGDLVSSSVESAGVICSGDTWNWQSDLNAPEPDDRFTAVKAARWLGDEVTASVLQEIVNDPATDWRLRLEAAASLSPHDPTVVDAIRDRVLAADARPEERMEGVFVLSELTEPGAVPALAAVAESVVLPEVAAAAVWGIGLGAASEPATLVEFLADRENMVALHAAAALPDVLPTELRDQLLGWLTTGTRRAATIAAHVLARHGHISELLALPVSDETIRAIVLLAVGDMEQAKVMAATGSLNAHDKQVLRTLWTREDDWLRAPETDGGLDVLGRQRLRL